MEKAQQKMKSHGIKLLIFMIRKLIILMIMNTLLYIISMVEKFLNG
jgi:hypothetical protein